MPIGRIKVWREARNFGFIVTEGSSPDIFVHISEVKYRPIQQGDLVNFVLQFDVQGRPKAINVERAKQGERLSIWEELPEVRAKKAREVFSEALIARSEKNYERARQLFEQAIALSPDRNFFDAYAAMEKSLGHWDRVRKIYSDARKKFPTDVGILESLAMAERKAGNLQECIEILRMALNENPERISLHIHLADSIVDLVEQSWSFELLEEARAHYEEARRLGFLKYKAESKTKRSIPSIPIEERSSYHKMWILYQKRSRVAWLMLRKAGFEFVKWRINLPIGKTIPVNAWLLAKPKGYKYAELYSLDGNLLVYCPYSTKVNEAKVKQIEEFFKEQIKSDLSIKQDILFIVLPDVGILQNYLRSLLEDPESHPTIIPIDETKAYEVLNDDRNLHGFMEQLLSEWVFQRDLYKGNFPVSGRRFFGREREIGLLNQSINDGRSIGIFGLRKSGKTSLLYQLRLIRKEDVVAYVDPEASPRADCAWICWKAVQEWANQRQQEAKDLVLCKVRSDKDLPDFLEVIQLFASDVQYLMSTLLPDAKLILMIDEIEKVAPIKGQGWTHSLEFFKFLRGVAQQSQGKFVVLISGANPAICEMPQWYGEDNPVFLFFEEMYLPLLSEKECREMIITLGKGMGVEWEDQALRAIYELTGGHPFITRRLCSTLVGMFRERPLLVTADMVKRAKGEFLIQLHELFREIKERLIRDYPDEWEILEALAAGFSFEEIKQLSPNWPIALRHLEGYQLIERKENQLSIKIKLLHEWLIGGVK